MRSFALVAALALAGCGGSSATDEMLVVSAASSLQVPLTQCSDDSVRLSFAGSDELAAQIRQGVKPDVYAAANVELPEALAEEGLLEDVVIFAGNELVIAVPPGSPVRSLSDVARPGVVVVLGSKSVPVGAYARDALRGLPDRGREILANVRSEEPDAKGIVGKLVQGAADAGLVYRSDVKAAGNGLRAIALPPDLAPQVAYGAGVVTGAGEAARDYVAALRTGVCAEALRAAGFRAPERSW